MSSCLEEVGMNHLYLTKFAAVLLVFVQGVVLAAQDNTTIEEIEITGQRSLVGLRLAITVAEDGMYLLWNELNEDDLFDIYCVREARTGALIKQRRCEPGFVTEATSLNARDFFSQAFGSSGGGVITPNNPQAVVDYYTPIYHQKMKDMILKNSQMLEAVVNLQNLRTKLDEQKSAYFSKE